MPHPLTKPALSARSPLRRVAYLRDVVSWLSLAIRMHELNSSLENTTSVDELRNATSLVQQAQEVIGAIESYPDADRPVFGYVAKQVESLAVTSLRDASRLLAWRIRVESERMRAAVGLPPAYPRPKRGRPPIINQQPLAWPPPGISPSNCDSADQQHPSHPPTGDLT